MGLVDVWDLERDHDPAGGEVDSNPVDVLADRGHLVIADAGANTLLKARWDGAIHAVSEDSTSEPLELEPGTLTHPGGITGW